MMLAARSLQRHLTAVGRSSRPATAGALLSSRTVTRAYLRPTSAALSIKPTTAVQRGNETDTGPTDLPPPFNDAPRPTTSTKKSSGGGGGGGGRGGGGGHTTHSHTSPPAADVDVEGEGAWSSVLTNPRMIVQHLDEYIIGQDRAKKILAVAVYNHYQRVRANLMQRRVAELQQAASRHGAVHRDGFHAAMTPGYRATSDALSHGPPPPANTTSRLSSAGEAASMASQLPVDDTRPWLNPPTAGQHPRESSKEKPSASQTRMAGAFDPLDEHRLSAGQNNSWISHGHQT
ncbi:hypothetical protein SYNPS1DRAFT_28599, partial [Syncephalis pseudoplumigaleata]